MTAVSIAPGSQHRRAALHEVTGGGFADEGGVSGDEAAPREHEVRPADGGVALIGRVVDAHVQGRGVQRLWPGWVPHDHVGVAADAE